MFAAAVLSPTAALGKAGGTDLPFESTGSGTAIFIPATGSLVAEIADTGTYIGKGTTRYEQSATVTGLGTVSLSGPVVTVAADGDELRGDLSGSGTFTPECVLAVSGCIADFDGVITITGGTGRFKGAGGAVAVKIHSVLTSVDGGARTYSATSRGKGTITPGPRCDKAQGKLAAAKKKLTRLKARDAKRSKIRRAKKKVGRTKNAVAEACP